MANNEHVNKVEYFGQTIMDITDTTATAGDVDSGKVFYAASGLRTVGTGDSVKTITMNGTTYSPSSGDVNLGNVVTDISGKADKADTVLDTTLSRGRADGSTVGPGSFAFGTGVTASGYYTHAEGKNALAYGNYSHAEGEHTNAYGQSSHVVGRYNSNDSYVNWPAWTSGESYGVGDKVQRINNGNRTGYICNTANADTEFDSTKWDIDTLMNFAYIVGNGKNTNSRCNAMAVDWNGNGYLYGDLYVDCDSDSAGGTSVISFSPQIGEIRMWAGYTAPDKWMICDGSVINRQTYWDLFAEIGTTYGGGDGSTTFAIPNFNGRSPIGVGDSGTTGHTIHPLGTDGGEESHVLSIAELASHGHGTSVSASATTTGKYKKNAQSGSNTNRVDSDGSSSTSGPYHTTVNVSVTVNNNGSNSAHNNMSPYCTVNFIIYTGVKETA